MLDAIILFFSAAIVNNFVLVRFLGLCPFIGVSNHLSAALGMGGATTFVLTLTAGCCFGVNNLILAPLGLSSLDLIVDIVIIAIAVQLVEIINSIVYALGAGCGFTLVLTLFAAIRERLQIADVPLPFKGTPVALIAAGLMSLAFMGFAGFTGSAV